MSPLDESQVYAAIGPEGFERLCKAFYRRVPDDDVLAPMYPPQDLVTAERHLRDFLIYRFGGPTTYIEQRGHPRMRLRHAPFRITPTARDRWMQSMNEALAEADLPEDALATLSRFFEQMSTFMINSEQ